MALRVGDVRKPNVTVGECEDTWWYIQVYTGKRCTQNFADHGLLSLFFISIFFSSLLLTILGVNKSYRY